MPWRRGHFCFLEVIIMDLPIYDYPDICKSCSKRVCVCALIAMVMLHDGVISAHIPVCPYDLHFVSVAPPDVDED